MIHPRYKTRKGFTIIELLVVIAVIGILAGITIVTYGLWRQNVTIQSMKSDLNGAAAAMRSSANFSNTFPACVSSPNTCGGFAPSNGDVLTGGGRSDLTSFCIQATNPSFPSLSYYYDSSANGSEIQSGTCPLLAITASLLAAATPNTGTLITLTWTLVGGATSYNEQCALDNGFTSGLVTATATTSPSTVSGLAASTAYYCRVQSVNTSGTSGWSASTQASTGVKTLTWTKQTALGTANWRALASSADGSKIAVAAGSGGGGYIYTSSDSGSTWTQRTGAPSGVWQFSIGMSADGTKILAGQSSGYIYTSGDSGATWTQQTGPGTGGWYGMSVSSDGTKAIVGQNAGALYTTSNSGATWTKITSLGTSTQWEGTASSSDGTNLAVVSTTSIYTSSNSGSTWTQQTGAGTHTWQGIASSSDGTKLVAIAGFYSGSTDYIYTSTDSGVTWTQRTSAGLRAWSSIASSSDGTHLIAGTDIGGDYVYISTDSGVTWTPQTIIGTSGVWMVATSTDGTHLVATAANGYLYTGVFQ